MATCTLHAGPFLRTIVPRKLHGCTDIQLGAQLIWKLAMMYNVISEDAQQMEIMGILFRTPSNLVIVLVQMHQHLSSCVGQLRFCQPLKTEIWTNV